ncbi:MAG: 6-phosphofructokinase, partial [Oscillospiraceae bacterium]|nr:6-phosphofructokinase [Oscillospiraceae bacterium]
GGDAPGMNAAIRAVTRAGIYNGFQIKGIYRGYDGLINGEVKPFTTENVSGIIMQGGTILKTARSKEFMTPEGMQKAYDTLVKENIDALVVIGGNGSLTGARNFAAEYDVPCIGLPGTIDNDISCTDYTIGYDTCLNTIVQMVDRIRDTSESHDRCTVVEVMGRGAGYLALEAGIAVGATSIIVPEVEYDIERDVIARIREFQKTGKKHFIVIVAEGVGGTAEIAKKIEAETGVESRATILGHVQRGGSPTARDRIMASQMGSRAVDLLTQGIGNRVVGIRDNKIVDFDIFEALKMTKTIDMKDYELAHEISI